MVSEIVPTAAALDKGFSDLYDRESLPVLRFLRNRVDGDAQAEDLCGDVFFKAWRGWPRFRGGDIEARSWLFRIARNAATDAHRRGMRARVLPLGRPGPGLHTTEPATLELINLRNSLARLRLADRELLALRAAGLSYEEIAVIRGGRGDAARVAWGRAAQRLHEMMEAD